jgi:drug/metabolite transporter (DMT)-like permease
MTAVAFALLAALCTAVEVVLQRIAHVHAPEGADRGWRLIRHLAAHPVWLLGTATMGAGFAFHAVALHFGPLGLVQPVLVTELLFTLLLRRYWLKFQVSGRAWGAALLTCLGLVALLVAAQPSGGRPQPTAGSWIGAVVAVGVLTAALLWASRSGDPRRRAALCGAAAGLVWAIDAAFVKMATNVLAVDGWWGLFSHWPLYALVGTGVLGTLLLQLALQVGPLASSQPLVVTVDPLVSIVLGGWLFHERFAHGPLLVIVAVAAFGVMALGVALLAKTALACELLHPGAPVIARYDLEPADPVPGASTSTDRGG